MVEHLHTQLEAALETLRHDFHFPGHLIPGTAFIIMGVWWILNAYKIHNKNEKLTNSDGLLSYEKSRNEANDLESFRATYSGDGFLRCEGLYKIAYASFDLFCHVLVVISGADAVNEEQHITIYVFFILNGIIDLNLHMKLYKMPSGTDYIASAITWAALGFLFISHKHAKTAVSIYYHQTFGWIAVSIAIVTLIQCKYDKNTLVALARGSCTILSGTWLYQIAIGFHNPFIAANQFRNIGREAIGMDLQMEKLLSHATGTDAAMTEHVDIMHAATYFTWHLILVGIITVILGVIANRKQDVYYKRIPSCCV